MKKQTIAIMLALVLILGTVFTGCGKKTVSDNADDVVTLKWILPGPGQQKDSEMVWKEFNKKLAEYLPNTTVEFEVIPNSDFAEKWRLMAAANEEVDLVWVGWMLNLYEEVQKGSLLAIDEYLPSVPDLTNEIPEHIINLGRINGKLYCVPNYQIMTNLPYGTKTQGELAEKYLDAEKITKNFDKAEAPTKEDYKVFEEYLEKLSAAGKLQKGVSKTFITSILGRIGGLGNYEEVIAGNAVIDRRDPELKVYNSLTDFPDKNAKYEIANDWYKKGYIRKDVLSVQDYSADENKKDGYVLWSHSCFANDSETQTKRYGFPILSVPTFQDIYIPATRPASNTGIARTCKNPERAMKLLELMNTQKGAELYNLLTFGIEGVHYEKTDKENIINYLEPSAPGSADNAYGFYNWAIGNIFNGYETQYDVEGWNDYILNDVNGKATPSPLIGFTLDTSEIKLELAQYNAIFAEYEYLALGANDNWEELLAERDAKLKKAGSDKIVEEVRRQIEQWKKVK